MQITDEMVKAAMNKFVERQGDNWDTYEFAMRAAIEAALGASKELPAAEVLERVAKDELSDPVTDDVSVALALENVDLCEKLRKSSACIEDLAAALKTFAEQANTHSEKIPDSMFIDDYERLPGDTWVSFAGLRVGDLRRARATLERWGLK